MNLFLSYYKFPQICLFLTPPRAGVHFAALAAR